MCPSKKGLAEEKGGRREEKGSRMLWKGHRVETMSREKSLLAGEGGKGKRCRRLHANLLGERNSHLSSGGEASPTSGRERERRRGTGGGVVDDVQNRGCSAS